MKYLFPKENICIEADNPKEAKRILKAKLRNKDTNKNKKDKKDKKIKKPILNYNG